MKTHGAMEAQVHAFLTSALGGGEWSASHLDHSIPDEGSPISFIVNIFKSKYLAKYKENNFLHCCAMSFITDFV
jgi:hypothetical protein